MSKFEPSEYVDDRYKKMDERLSVRHLDAGTCLPALLGEHCHTAVRTATQARLSGQNIVWLLQTIKCYQYH